MNDYQIKLRNTFKTMPLAGAHETEGTGVSILVLLSIVEMELQHGCPDLAGMFYRPIILYVI